ncbi:serine protease [Kitasatospora sp. NPDC004669]|uniref:S1 family peptidase n=1 Tax=Kitasatospora sp. NPDC004669 TaxID=3154555 RepID=UPI0033B91206
MTRFTLPKILGATATAAALALAAPVASAHAAAGPDIVGGGSASQTYSFMVSLQDSNGHECGASLISPTWAVTAAHCVDGSSAADFTVRVGSTDRTNGGEVSAVSQFIPHPSYNSASGNNYDIALIQLATPVQATPIGIADSSPAVGTAIRLLGWGQEQPQRGADNGPDQLKELDTSVVGSGCAEGFDAHSELCVNNPQGPDGSNQGACYGDSGGPAVAQVAGAWRLVGATSRAGSADSTCAVAPSIYTDVTAYRDFIRSNAGI